MNEQKQGELTLGERRYLERVRHPSGWLIECRMWPDPQWLSELMGVRP